eukprot:CCRYP_004143-RA/>CCRYP_004143-RA protein AED:0.33 eAED:0.33 QI:124/1/1/1/1/1/3/89/304
MKLKTLLLTILSILPPTAHSSNIAKDHDLVSEMAQLQNSLTRLQSLLNDASVGENEEIMKKAEKLFRRARWLIFSSNHETSSKSEPPTAQHLRGNSNYASGIGSGEMSNNGESRDMESTSSRIVGRNDIDSREVRQMDADHVARNMYEATIVFPECRELFLEDCLQLIASELAALQMSCEVIIREKRSLNQPGYNKVVIVTDLSATVVKGRNGDGIVSYPFMWEDPISGFRTLGVDGKWDCKEMTPEDCCAKIQASAPESDVRGNYLQCHIFVPFGGVGNRKRSDRVFVNLSQDGRVQETPFVS